MRTKRQLNKPDIAKLKADLGNTRTKEEQFKLSARIYTDNSTKKGEPLCQPKMLTQ